MSEEEPGFVVKDEVKIGRPPTYTSEERQVRDREHNRYVSIIVSESI